MKKTNPLTAFMRQPKIYIALPSGGQYYPPQTIDLGENIQLAVYSMTAKDELLLNVPDALMNGQAVVDVIQNCIPAIKNAWYVPSIDIDLILLAIRLATYGENMNTPVKINNDIEYEYQVDLRIVMDNILNNFSWDPIIAISDEMTIYVRPLYYKEMTKNALQTFETQKIMQAVNDDKLSEEQKQEIFKKSFNKLSEVTLGIISNSIIKIDTSEGSVDDPGFIREFIENADKEIFNKIQIHLDRLKDRNSIKPIIVSVTDEMKEKGITGETIEVPLTFDPSTFFV
jgi:hypothetical protein